MAIVVPRSVVTNDSLHDARMAIDELARLEHLGEVAKKWAALREATGSAKELEHALLELRKLARLAKAERKSLLLRVAL